MRNPFEFGRELSAAELVDREDELLTLGRAIAEAGKVFLIGPRRFGKTSLLAVAAVAAESKGAVVLRYDAEAFPTLERLAEQMVADTAARLSATVEKAGELMKKIFAHLSPEASFSPDGGWSVRLSGGGRPADESGVPLIAQVLDGIERAARRQSGPVVVMIDEFQKLVEGNGPRAEEQIRASIQRHRRVGYVFAGSATSLLTEMTTQADRPFYRLGSSIFLGAVPRAAFAEFLTRSFGRSHIKVGAGSVEAILDAAEDVPYNVQLLAHSCWSACRERVDSESGRGALPLTPSLVAETHRRLALRSDPLYTQLWNELSSTQQRALLAVLREGDEGGRLASTEIVQRYDMPVTTMQKALAALRRKRIVRDEQARGESRLRLEDPLFGTWVRLVVAL